MIVVVDSNVWVSAFLSRSEVPAQVVGACLHGAVTFAATKHLLEELEQVFDYERIRTALEARGVIEEARAAIALLRRTVLLVKDVEPRQQWVLDDPDDDWVIQCALSADADYIVSGDQNLLSLRRVGATRIVSPSDFMNEVLGPTAR